MAALDLYVRALKLDWSAVAPDSWLRDIPALKGLERLEFEAPVTFFCGENGSGKSTLLEALAVCAGYNAEGGTRNYCFSTYEDVSELAGAASLVRGARRPRTGYFFRAESFFNVATVTNLEYNDGSMPDYHAASHGESFLAFMQGAGPQGLYLMDEPEAALSPQRQLTLLIHIVDMARRGAQFVIATHSPILLGTPGAQILSFDGEHIRPVAWQDTDSYAVTRLFLENREDLLRRMLGDGDAGL